ncbi:WhiB family transcriptional regulator [Mycobacterium heckeshornense]|uniref:WhiB family transcriptional regulator n=1 Tax=Mycobacterium heckeshornense TaxID=110505 RepID=UPI000B08C6F7|nr:WhiB family transcriptional regulator [Mycobacterium heckeshornense]
MTNHWVHRAACVGTPTDLFYPDKTTNHTTITHAKRICASCPVQPNCLHHALETPEPFGIWGGLTEWERHHLRPHQPRGRHTDCGTRNGYRAHLRRREPPCPACRHANTINTHQQRAKQRHNGGAA